MPVKYSNFLPASELLTCTTTCVCVKTYTRRKEISQSTSLNVQLLKKPPFRINYSCNSLCLFSLSLLGRHQPLEKPLFEANERTSQALTSVLAFSLSQKKRRSGERTHNERGDRKINHVSSRAKRTTLNVCVPQLLGLGKKGTHVCVCLSKKAASFMYMWYLIYMNARLR